MSSETRTAAAAHAIREAIRGGRIMSGERLVEVKLAQSLDVSQNTIRDALYLLEQEGWVIKQARRGVYVRSFTPEDAAEICALIESIETLVLGWALAHLDKESRADLRHKIAAARKAAYTGDHQAAFDHLIRFHERIAAAAERPITTRLLATLYNQVQLLEALRQARAPRTAPELDTLIAAHEALLHAVERGSLDDACDRLRELIALYSAATVAALRV